MSQRHVILMDATIATGAAAIMAIRILLVRHYNEISAILLPFDLPLDNLSLIRRTTTSLKRTSSL